MAKQNSLPLYERIESKNTLHKVMEFIILFLLLSLLAYRLLSFDNYGFPWLIAFLCELWFTLNFVMQISNKWSYVEYKTYPEHLLQRLGEDELPPVDMFVTTADAELEPPIITVNTVLSLLALDYPADKLACYVSDDGCSSITFYSLVEASKFSKLWVPFCKKYNTQARAPFRYFSNNNSLHSGNNSAEFKQEWKTVKDEYEQLGRKIEDAVAKSSPFDGSEDFAVFSNVQRNNHPTIIKVLWENKEGASNGVPRLVYISREKRPNHPHHAKAGAMNVLARVSGLMTNAPFMLNVDCDMFANNPKVISHAMCTLLESKNQNDTAFVQFPQRFYDALKDDPFGNLLEVSWNYIGHGTNDIQGIYYCGTGCFHRRKVIYGLSPRSCEIGERNLEKTKGKSADEELLKTFGNSKEFTKSAADALKGDDAGSPYMLPKSVEAAYQVAGCQYEYGTYWGRKVGWMYGSTMEDVLTGLSIHSRGWRSIFCSPSPPGFMGNAPNGGPTSITQMKRWSTGLLEILFSKNSPIIATLFADLRFRQCLAYLWQLSWTMRSVPEIFYSALPAYSIITNTRFLPKGEEPAFYIPVAIFVMWNIFSLFEYLQTGLSVRAWWNNQKMARVTTMSAYVFGVIAIILKLLGISKAVFEITRKEHSNSSDEGTEDTEAGRFTFDNSPFFVPPTTILLLQLTALASALTGLRPPARDGQGSGPLEAVCSLSVVLCLWPFLKGLFGTGKYGIPLSIIFKSAGFTLLFYTLSRHGYAW